MIDNDNGGHKDLLFMINGLVDSKSFDTYYFAFAIEPISGLTNIKNAVGQLISFWRDKTLELKDSETIYLPIDFSDQYTGCLRVVRDKDEVVLTYGNSRVEGHAVNPLNPINYYKVIKDFEADSGELKLDLKEFTHNLYGEERKLITK